MPFDNAITAICLGFVKSFIGAVGTSAVSAALMLDAKNVVYSMFLLEEEAFYAIHAV